MPTYLSPLRVSVVLPAFNEEGIIRASVLHAAEAVAPLVPEYEIVVTNDGSTDRTAAVLQQLQRERPDLPLRVVTHERNQGYGAALASGFDAARLDAIFLTDGDKQFDVREIAQFLPQLAGQCDVAIGWRQQRADPPIRLLNAWGWKLLVNALFGVRFRDVDCAFKLFRREVWDGVVVHARGATFSAELLVKAQRLGFRVVQLPVRHYPRTHGSATGARPAVILRAFRELFALRRNIDRELAEDSGPVALVVDR